MKSIYLNQVMGVESPHMNEVLLIIREKTVYNNSIKYILGDITGDVEFISKLEVNIGDIVKSIIVNNSINKISIYKGEYDLRDYMPYVKRNVESILMELEELTTDKFQSNEALELNKYFFGNKDFIDAFSMGIGGLGHHTYIGGLAEHTLSVVYWANKLADRYNCKYRDIAVLAAKLHDIGKIYEYDSRGVFKSTFRGEMEGHIVIGITMIEDAFRHKPSIYSETFKNRIKGCIVQHHGMPEYGSPKSPNTEEAFIVHYSDYIDATMNKVYSVKEKTKDNTWSEYNEELKTKIFI